VALHRLACGEETVAFVPDPLREVLREGVELDFPLGALEPFLFVASGILSRLERRLELRGEGFSEVLLEMHLEGGGHRECRLKLVAPTREVPAVLALARLQLEASPPGAPVEGVAALVKPGRVRLAQSSLFGPPRRAGSFRPRWPAWRRWWDRTRWARRPSPTPAVGAWCVVPLPRLRTGTGQKAAQDSILAVGNCALRPAR
jgi:hypothetical protein